jgi:hypothetical protein
MHVRSLFPLAVVTTLAVIGIVAADEEKVALDKLPKAVSEAVKKKFAGAELTGASKETENGKTVFEVSVKHKGHKMDVTVTEAGMIETIEKEIAAKDLPAGVRSAIDKKYPNATFKIVEEIIKVKDNKDTLDVYEVLLVSTDKKTMEVCVAPDGKITKEEEKREEEKKEVEKKDKK